MPRLKKVHSCGKILIASIWWMIVYNFRKIFAEKNLYANRKAILSAGVVAFFAVADAEKEPVGNG